MAAVTAQADERVVDERKAARAPMSDLYSYRLTDPAGKEFARLRNYGTQGTRQPPPDPGRFITSPGPVSGAPNGVRTRVATSGVC
jgi:hypothetical protein